MNSKARRKTLLCFSTILALTLCATTHTANAQSGPDSISIGTDYFQTQAGTWFNFGTPFGVVDFKGVPIGPGNTDTIVQRQKGSALTPGGAAVTVNTQLTNLSLESTAPLTLGTDSYNAFVTLDPANLANDTGTLQVSLNAAGTGGTFDSTLNVYFDVTFQQVGGPPSPIPTIDGYQQLTSASPTDWSTTPPASGAWLVSGTDDGFSDDQNANIHTGLDPGELDFWPGVDPSNGQVVPIAETHPFISHIVDPTPTPEPGPGSLLLLATGFLGLGILGRKRFLPGARK
jgi:hypothetical protein